MLLLLETGSEATRTVLGKRAKEACWRHEYSRCKGLYHMNNCYWFVWKLYHFWHRHS